MNMTRYTGGPEYNTLRKEMDRLFESFFPARSEGEASSAVWAPRADLAETDDAYVITMDLPGIVPDDLEVTFEEGALRVSGERSASRKHESAQYHRIERSYGRFFRSFNFGNNADPEAIEAEFSDGVLTLTVGKREASKPRRIEVGRRVSANGDAVETN